VRVALPASNELPIDQRVRVTSCFLSDCRLGLMQAALQQTRAAVGSLYEAATSVGVEAKGLVRRLASVQRSNRTL